MRTIGLILVVAILIVAVAGLRSRPPVVVTAPPAAVTQPTALSPTTVDAGAAAAGDAVPHSADEAARRFGGGAADWQPVGANGWVLRAAAAVLLRIPAGYRVDYPGHSCAETGAPGVYGPAAVAAAAATIWAVGAEAACPAWTVWGQAHAT